MHGKEKERTRCNTIGTEKTVEYKKSEIIIGADKAGGIRTNEKAPEKGVIRKIKKKSRENEQKEYDRTHPADKAEPG